MATKTRTKKTWKAPYLEFLRDGEEMYARILSMNNEQRRALLESLMKCDEMNCSWIIYAMRKLLAEFIAAATERPSDLASQAQAFADSIR